MVIPYGGESSPPAEGCRNGGVVFVPRFYTIWNLNPLTLRVPSPILGENLIWKTKSNQKFYVIAREC